MVGGSLANEVSLERARQTRYLVIYLYSPLLVLVNQSKTFSRSPTSSISPDS